MKIEWVKFYRVTLPFLESFPISLREGRSSTRVVVEISADQGKVRGYGEGLPIATATGETPETVMEDAKVFVSDGRFPRELTEIDQIWDFVDLLPEGKGHNAAVCAVETALLDALGKAGRRPVLDYLPRSFYTDTICYGVSITLGDRARIEGICKMIKSFGITHIRIKMGLDLEQNRTALETVSEIFGDDCEKRVDPNGVWDFDLAMRHLPLLIKHSVSIIEEPMPTTGERFAVFARAVQAEGLTLMACESAPTLKDVKRAIFEGFYHMFNVKLCRSGGFRRTLQILAHLRQNKKPYQIGCTLGESGLLSAAGRSLGLVCSDAVTYDGSYDRFMLRENVVEEPVGFGPGGKAGPLGGSGLGVKVNREKLARLSDFTTSVYVG
jgi:L-Ala-D/L-Glu epimerase